MKRASVAFAIVLLAAHARADDRAEATASFNEGMDLRAAGKTREAAEKLRAAHTLYPTSITGVELGRTLMLLGKLRDARDAFASVSRIGPRPNESARANNARAEAAALAVQVGEKLPHLRFHHDASPPAVRVDGAPVSDLDATMDLDPGAHTIVISRASTPETKQITLTEGKTELVELVIATTTTTNPPIERPPPPTIEHPNRTGFWIGVGATGVALALGGVSGGIAIANADSARPSCSGNICAPSVASQVDAAKTWSTVSTVSFITAGVFAIVSVVLFVATGSSRHVARLETFSVSF